MLNVIIPLLIISVHWNWNIKWGNLLPGDKRNVCLCRTWDTITPRLASFIFSWWASDSPVNKLKTVFSTERARYKEEGFSFALRVLCLDGGLLLSGPMGMIPKRIIVLCLGISFPLDFFHLLIQIPLLRLTLYAISCLQLQFFPF